MLVEVTLDVVLVVVVEVVEVLVVLLVEVEVGGVSVCDVEVGFDEVLEEEVVLCVVVVGGGGVGVGVVVAIQDNQIVNWSAFCNNRHDITDTRGKVKRHVHLTVEDVGVVVGVGAPAPELPDPGGEFPPFPPGGGILMMALRTARA